MFTVIVKISTRGALLSEEDLSGNLHTIAFDMEDLSIADRKNLAARLHQDKYACRGVVNDAGEVEPRLDDRGNPVLLIVNGTEMDELSKALDEDHAAVEDYIASLRAKEEKPEA